MILNAGTYNPIALHSQPQSTLCLIAKSRKLYKLAHGWALQEYIRMRRKTNHFAQVNRSGHCKEIQITPQLMHKLVSARECKSPRIDCKASNDFPEKF